VFNKTEIIQAPRTEYVPYEKSVTITEKRAPTDESIRLAKEYEEKAWAIVANRVLRDVPDIEAKMVVIEECFDTRERLVLFKVNGKPVTMRRDAAKLVQTKDDFQELINGIAQELAIQLFKVKP